MVSVGSIVALYRIWASSSQQSNWQVFESSAVAENPSTAFVFDAPLVRNGKIVSPRHTTQGRTVQYRFLSSTQSITRGHSFQLEV